MALVIAAFALLWKIDICKNKEFYTNNFSAQHTRSLKGIFALFVILHHLCTYLADYFPSFFAFKYIGFLMVGGFFLVSGYGLTYGVLNRENYLKGFLRKRILAILVPYYIINVFNMAANYLCDALTLKYIVFSIFGITMWYIAAILCLYIMFFVCFKLFKTKTAMYLISICTLLYIGGMFAIHKIFGKYGLYAVTGLPEFGFWWYNSAICFLLGCWYCKLKEKIDLFIKSHYFRVLLPSFAACALTYYISCRHFNDNLTYILICEIICSIAFTAFLLTLTYKIKFGNKFLDMCGNLSLELYLCHALFIYAYRCDLTVWGIRLYIENHLLYFVAIMVSSFIFSQIVHKISGVILRLITLAPKPVLKEQETKQTAKV